MKRPWLIAVLPDRRDRINDTQATVRRRRTGLLIAGSFGPLAAAGAACPRR
jgi:hypothetical protein